jgi:hypothetical protein
VLGQVMVSITEITEIAGSAGLASLESSDNSLSYIAQGSRGAPTGCCSPCSTRLAMRDAGRARPGQQRFSARMPSA